MIKILKILALLAISVFLSSCPQENPLLVSPAPQSDFIYVRFVNLASDNIARKLVMDSEVETDLVPTFSSSEAINPPFDSVTAQLFTAQGIDFEFERKLRFARDLSFTIVALPLPNGGGLDTAMFFSNSSTLDRLTNDAYVKLYNAIPNSTATLYIGCPGGTTANSFMPFGRVGGIYNLPSGLNTFTLMVTKDGISTIAGTYSIDLERIKQYCFFAVEQNGIIETYLLDEADREATAFKRLIKEDRPSADLRLINMSNSQTDLKLIGQENDIDLFNDVSDNYVSSYKDVATCLSPQGTRMRMDNSSTSFSILLENFQNNSILIYDKNAQGEKGFLPIIPVKIFDTTAPDRAAIRVVNLDYTNEAINVSLGANSFQVNPLNQEAVLRGYTSGFALAQRLFFPAIAGTGLVRPGKLPISVFTSTEPANFITCGNYNFEAGKSYLILIKPVGNQKRIFVIEDTQENTPIIPIEQGALLQVINAVSDESELKVELNTGGVDLIFNATLFNGLSLGTIVDAGQLRLNIDGKEKNYEIEIGKRYLVVAGGSKDNLDIFDYSNPALANMPGFYRRRFINLSPNFGSMEMRLAQEAGAEFFGLEYGQISNYQNFDRDDRHNFHFYFSGVNELKARADDIKFNVNKIYTVIVKGNFTQILPYTQTGLTLIFVQEF